MPKMKELFYFFLLIKLCDLVIADRNPNAIKVNKCCEKFEILVNQRCANVNETGSTKWQPVFYNTNGDSNVQVEFWVAVGSPRCDQSQQWPIYDYKNSKDKLYLLSDGKLRHHYRVDEDIEDDRFILTQDCVAPNCYDYEQGQYCMDVSIDSIGIQQFAKVCSQQKIIHWTDTDFLLRKILNPILHGISMIILLVVAIIYFVLPSLRDLVGNIITSLTLCLIISQAADLVRIFTEFSSHISFLVADTILYVSLLAAFFWLNTLGYYIWKTFSSRNVFLRVTDGKKYCWYSTYVWCCTAIMAGLAVFAHFFLDAEPTKKTNIIGEQETIGWLGISIFFTPIAIIILVNLYFYIATLQILSRRSTFGRIHHKLKSSFVMFTLIFLVMSIAWLFLILSWMPGDGLLYAHIITNAIQAPALLYICVLRQKHVKHLLTKSCCYNEPPSAADWGDEMTYMNTADF